MDYTYAPKRLDKARLDKVQELERKFGYCVVALEKSTKPAPISESQAEELKNAEKEMGAILVAYDCECKKQ